MENGVNSEIITVSKEDLEGYHPKFVVNHKPLQEFYSENFWLENDSDVIVAYPLQGPYYSPMIEKMKAAKKKVLLKFDSDGRIAYPLQRHTFRVPLRERFTLSNVVSDVWWRLAPKAFKRKRHASVAAETIRQIELCDAAIIESPSAQANLNYFLTAWGRSDLTKKTHFVPNPVSPEFLLGVIPPKDKVVVSFGRWDDYKQKNTAVMAQTALRFLKERPDYKFIIFGRGTNSVEDLVKQAPQEIRQRLCIQAFVERTQVKTLLAGARIFFVPSRWESFNISSGEALCVGCSVVGTPLESLQYLTNGGFSGTLASSFKAPGILAALLEDAKKWDNDKYGSEGIAAFWRPKLDRKAVAKCIVELAEKER